MDQPETRVHYSCNHGAEKGMTMIVVLMLLMLMSSAAIFSARYATIGESMARNQLDYERAKQAAESALRDAERDILLPGPPFGLNPRQCALKNLLLLLHNSRTSLSHLVGHKRLHLGAELVLPAG